MALPDPSVWTIVAAAVETRTRSGVRAHGGVFSEKLPVFRPGQTGDDSPVHGGFMAFEGPAQKSSPDYASAAWVMPTQKSRHSTGAVDGSNSGAASGRDAGRNGGLCARMRASSGVRFAFFALHG